MYQNYDAIKLLLEERHRELITQKYVYHQLNGNNESRIKSWATGQLNALLENLGRPSVIDRLFRKQIRSTQSGFELNECQATPECQTC
jgi:hypothetical protein